jgi:DNA-directed RNA polymerase alpha subunit
MINTKTMETALKEAHGFVEVTVEEISKKVKNISAKDRQGLLTEIRVILNESVFKIWFLDEDEILDMDTIADTIIAHSEDRLRVLTGEIERLVARDIKIERLNLNMRAYNCMIREGYKRLSQMADLSERELSNMHQLGDKSVREVIDVLTKHGITLRKQ